MMNIRKLIPEIIIISVILISNIYCLATDTFAACPSDMIAYWQMEEDAMDGGFVGYLDKTVYSNTGVCSGVCPTLSNDGVVGNGQNFDGNNSGMEVAANTIFDFGRSDNFTIELWLKLDSISGSEVLIGRDSNTSSMSWWVGVRSSGRIAFSLTSSNGQSELIESSSDKVIVNGLWHHVAAVRFNNQNRLYVDGILENIVTRTYTSGFETTEPISIGYLNDGTPGFYFNGRLDEVAIYNRALTANEIQSHYFLSRGYCNLYDDKVRIMPLGDSITYDDYSGAPPGTGWRVAYRQPLWLSLDSNFFWIDFVGSVVAGEDVDPPFDTDNEGHAGIQDDEVADQVLGWLNANPADVVLLHIGTNDLDTNPSDVNSILDKIDLFSESTTVVLARIIERVGDDGTTHLFNNAVEAMALSRIDNGDKIIIVDMEDGAGIDYTIGVDMEDDLHPNQSGYGKMADVWYAALEDFLPQSFAPEILSMPNTEINKGEVYSYQIDVDGYPEPVLKLTAPNPFPDNFNFDPGNSLITWMPGANAIDLSVVIEATNWKGTDTQSYTIDVNKAPQPQSNSGSGSGCFISTILQ